MDLRQLGVDPSKLPDEARSVLDDLVGRQVAAVVNLPAKQIGKFMSEILVLGFPDTDGEVVMIQPTATVPDGGRLY